MDWLVTLGIGCNGASVILVMCVRIVMLTSEAVTSNGCARYNNVIIMNETNMLDSANGTILLAITHHDASVSACVAHDRYSFYCSCADAYGSAMTAIGHDILSLQQCF